jgi:lipoprotein NlpI
MKRAALIASVLAFALAAGSPAYATWTADATRCAQGGDDPKGTVAACTRAIDSGSLNALEKARSLHNRALARARLKDFSPAITDLTQAIELDPKNGEHHYTRAEVSMLRSQYPQAIADIDSGLRLDGPSVRGEHLLGLAHAKNGDLDASAADFTAALKLAPRDIQLLNDRGNVYFAKRDWDRALADYTQAIAIEPKNAVLYHNRAEVWRFTNDLTRARQDLDTAIKLDPNYESAYIRRGLVRIEAHTYPEALADFDKALQLDPNSSAVLMQRGVARFYAGRFADAETDLVASVAAGPKNPYSPLWLYLVRRHQGRNAIGDLRAEAKKLNLGSFPGPIVRFYLGEIKAGDVLLASREGSAQERNERLCETAFYLGEEALARGDRDTAIAYFRQSTGTGLHYIFEYQGAAVEMQRLGL